MEIVNLKEMRFVEDIKIIKNKRAQTLVGHKQFVDKDFPTEMGIAAANDRQIHWKRITELDSEAQLFAQPNHFAGALEAGILSNHNFVATLTAILNHPKLMDYVFPPGQDFTSPEYCGFFYFRFWNMGKWVYVYVDDRIPILGKKVVDPAKKNRSKKTPGSRRTSEGSDIKTGSKLKLDDSSKKVADPSVLSDHHGSSKKVIDPAELTEHHGSSKKVTDPGEEPDHHGSSKKVTDPAEQSDHHNSSKKVTDPAEQPDDHSSSKKVTDLAEQSNHNGSSKIDPSEKTDRPKESQNDPKNNSNVNGHKNGFETSAQKSDEEAASNKAKPVSLTVGSKKGKTDENKQPETSRGDDMKDETSKPIFIQVLDPNGKFIYWATLMEKAYAKFCGGYHLMANMGIVETLLDLTGGVVEVFYTNHLPPNFFLSLKHFTDNRCIILATSPMAKKEEENQENTQNNGVLFSVTQAVFADFQKLLGIQKMLGFVRLRNPRGALDWENKWMEASQEWEILPAEVKKKLRMTDRFGEFYLTYNNFLKAYSSLIVSTVPDGDNFNCEGYFGIWTRPRLKYNLCNLDELRFHQFPQHKIWVRDPNSDDNIFVELEPGRTYTPPLSFDFFRFNRPIGCSNYSAEKEISARFQLPPGHYLIVVVPDHTNLEHPCLTNDYLLRVVTPAKFPKPPPPHMAVTFCESENLNIYFDYAEVIEEPKTVVAVGPKGTIQSDTSRSAHKDKSRTKKKKAKH